MEVVLQACGIFKDLFSFFPISSAYSIFVLSYSELAVFSDSTVSLYIDVCLPMSPAPHMLVQQSSEWEGGRFLKMGRALSWASSPILSVILFFLGA